MPPQFERWGYGFKAGYNYSSSNDAKINLVLSTFHAKDKPQSLNYIPDSVLYAGENIVIGANVNASYAHFVFSTELASSVVTKNIHSDLEYKVQRWNSFMGSLIESNGTTESYSAGKFNLGYSNKNYTVGIGYERIDPGYETYGAYYFSNDMQNMTLNGSVKLLKDKINLSGNIGKQNDNLDKSKISEMTRWVTALNLSYNSGERLNANLSYSTFTSFMNIRSQFLNINQLTPYENLDTLDFTQLSESTSASVSYVIKNTEKNRQNMSLNLSRQTSADKQGGLDTTGSSKFYNAGASYMYSLVPINLTITAGLNMNVNDAPGMKSTTLGPTIALNKMMFKRKLRNSVSFSYNRAYTNGDVMMRVLNLRASSSCRIGKRHNLSLGLVMMNRKTGINTSPKKITEFIATLGYSMSF